MFSPAHLLLLLRSGAGTCAASASLRSVSTDRAPGCIPPVTAAAMAKTVTSSSAMTGKLGVTFVKAGTPPRRSDPVVVVLAPPFKADS